MQISAAGARSRELARFLTHHLQTSHVGLFLAIRDGDALDAVAGDESISLLIVEHSAEGDCSVAGTCDADRRIITVARASAGRMRYSVLHELGHLLMAECDEYQDAYVDLVGVAPNRARLTEDVCEAFAASLLLPESSEQLEDQGIRLDARGLRDLSHRHHASREACAVWMAQRLAAPGYAFICYSDGPLQFAARSGDALPLRRGASQRGSALEPLFSTNTTFRGRGRLRFGSGALGEELYIDAMRDGRLIYAIATTDSPGWPVLHQPASRPVVEAIEGWCDTCSTSFSAYRVCADCESPRHEECGTCECEPTTAGTARICTECFLELHPSRFSGASAVCRDCSS
jgi:hypothetical protein